MFSIETNYGFHVAREDSIDVKVLGNRSTVFKCFRGMWKHINIFFGSREHIDYIITPFLLAEDVLLDAKTQVNYLEEHLL